MAQSIDKSFAQRLNRDVKCLFPVQSYHLAMEIKVLEAKGNAAGCL